MERIWEQTDGMSLPECKINNLILVTPSQIFLKYDDDDYDDDDHHHHHHGNNNNHQPGNTV